MRIVSIVVLSLALLALVGAGSALLLWSCSIRLPVPGLGNCPTAAESVRIARLNALEDDNRDLLLRIAALETDLAGRQCTALPPDPNRPLEARDWQQEDIDALYGCWDLGGSYETRNVETRDEVGYPAWQICFDTKGQGRQIMRDMDGIACEGPVIGAFSQAGTLRIDEPANLPCGDGGYIHRREFTCTVVSDGLARCDTLQPETNGQMQVELRRAAREI